VVPPHHQSGGKDLSLLAEQVTVWLHNLHTQLTLPPSDGKTGVVQSTVP